MTSSLVGSEMCIRDRVSRIACTPRVPLPRPLPGPVTRSLMSPMRPLNPVSYTHLTLPTICSV
eukprot:8015640-Prorocentrum_lima.AAC.1